ncbi:Dihydroneopterin aldolase-domain-containing protein [Tirmania nivea]|nr:Dihydroneopterin aldolase-domain-containing protein [Tirmania nivea]
MDFTTHASPETRDSPDIVSIRALTLTTRIGPDIWYRNRPQPVIVSLTLYTDISKSGATDDVRASIHYGNLTKAVSTHITDSASDNLVEFVDSLAECCFLRGGAEERIKIVAELPEALTMAEGVGIEAYRQCYSQGSRSKNEIDRIPGFGDGIFIRNLRVACVIGVNEPERKEKQVVVVNLRLWDIDAKVAVEYRKLLQAVTEHIESSSYFTIEAMITTICRMICVDHGISKVTVRIEKPSALTFAKGAAVEITRMKEQFEISPEALGIV